MSYWQNISYLLLLVATTGLAAVLMWVVWQRRRASGALALMALLASAGLWSGAYALELASASLPIMIFWGNVGYLGIVGVPVAWFVFALHYADYSDRLTHRRLFGLLLIPLLTTCFVWTNSLHGLMRRDVGVGMAGPYSVIAKEYGSWFWLYVLYSYLLLLLGTIILLRRLYWRPHIYRKQSVALLLAIVFPWGANVIYLSGLSPLQRLDPTPIGFVLAGAALTWALVRYRLLDLAPIARVVVMETLDDGVIVFDGEKRIVDLNRGAVELIGEPEPAIVGKSVHAVFPDVSHLIEQCWSLPETYVDIRHGNPPQYYRLHMMMLAGRGQQAAGRLAIFRDITDWVQTTRALRRQEQRFRSLVHNSSDVISILSPEGRFQYASASAEQILGYSPDDLRGTRAVDWVHPEDRPAIQEIFRELLNTARNDLSAHFRFQHADGSWRFLEATGSNQLDDPAVEGIVVNTRDVTERVKAERAVRRRAEELAALHATSLAISQLDDLDTVLTTIVERAAGLLDAPGGGLYLCDVEREEVRCVVSYNTPEDYAEIVLAYGEGAAGTVAETGEPLIIEDYRQWHRRAEAFEDEQPFTAIVSAPMIWRDEVIGVIHVLHETEDRLFTTEDLDLLTLFAEQAAIAVENSRLYATQARRAEEAETLRQAGRAVVATLDRQEAIARILAQLQQVVTYDTASVQLLRDGYLEIVGGRGWDREAQVLELQFPIPGDNPNTTVIEERRPHRLDDAPAVYENFDEAPHNHIRSWLGVPLIVRDEVIGMLAVDSTRPNDFDDEDARLVNAFADQVAIAIVNSRLYTQVQRLATTDELTGLHNRRHFFELAERELRRARRHGQPVSAIMLDIDRFKEVNDTHGHGVGDEVLRTVARRLEQNIREIDILGRYGGEEFVVFLPDTEGAPAYEIAERLRRAVSRDAITTSRAGDVQITLSAGVAQATEKISDPMALVDQADAALYTAKAAGRNCVRTQ